MRTVFQGCTSSRRAFRSRPGILPAVVLCSALSLSLLLSLLLSRTRAWAPVVRRNHPLGAVDKRSPGGAERGRPLRGALLRRCPPSPRLMPMAMPMAMLPETPGRRKGTHRLYGVTADNTEDSSGEAETETEIPTGFYKISDLRDMDVVIYSLETETETTTGEGRDTPAALCLGALQEDGTLSPLSAWTDEPAFGDSIECLVDEEDRFVLAGATEEQRRREEGDGADGFGEARGGEMAGSTKLTGPVLRVHHLLSEDEVSYGSRQCPRGPHNPHGEESELLYYVSQERVLDRFGVAPALKPDLEILW